MKTYDVIVLGLGAMGSAAAHQLTARGVRVLGLEQYTAAHDRGSSHSGSRMIRFTLYREQAYVRLLARAYELWRQLERDAGVDVLAITGGLALGRPDHSVVDGGMRSAKEAGVPYEALTPAEVRRRFPPFAPEAGMIGVYEPSAGFLRPEAAIRASLDQAGRRGAELHFNEPALRWEAAPSGDRVRVITEAAAYETVREHLARRVPGLDGPCIAARTCMYTNTPDLHFVIGPHPAAPQCFVAAGFSGHGFKFASVVGEILADLAVGGATRHGIELFAPARFQDVRRSVQVPYV